MSDTNERSVGSAGSVAGEFVGRARAWRDERGYPTAGEMLDEAVAVIASLRLTDAEQEAVEMARAIFEQGGDEHDHDGDRARAAAMCGLLERMGGGR